MRIVRNRALKGATAICAAAVFAAATFATTAAAADQDVLVVATGTQFPPMGYLDPETHKLVGFDIDLGTALADEMGVEIKWVKTEFSQFMSGLKIGRFEAILGGISDKKERQDSATFIDYLNSGAQLFTTVAFSESKNIKKAADFCGKSIAGSRNSSLAADVRAWSTQHCPADEQIKVSGTDGSPMARLQMKQGRVDGVVQTTETIAYLQMQQPGQFVKVGKPITNVPYGMAFAVDDKELLKDVYAAYQRMVENGTYAKLIKKWGFDGQGIETPTINMKPASETLGN